MKLTEFTPPLKIRLERCDRCSGRGSVAKAGTYGRAQVLRRLRCP